ncbi:MAG: PilW family protein [Betaproteobacteria bacterium]
MTIRYIVPLRQSGVSIVELMVAMTIGLVLSGVAASVYLSSSKTYTVQDDLSRLQENGRTALDIVTRDLRMASFRGCNGRGITPKNALNATTAYAQNFLIGVQGFYGNGGSWTPAPPADFPVPPSATQASDVITIRKADSVAMPVSAPYMASPADAIQTFPGNGLSVGDIVLISDCYGAAVFQITGGSPDTSGAVVHTAGGSAPGNTINDVGRIFGSNAELARLTTATYYVAPSQFGTGPSLWRVIGTQAPEELAENIEQIRILFGVDTDGDLSANSFVPPGPALNMANVVSIRINMLVRTGNDNVATQPQTYFFNGANVAAADRRIRRAFSTTVNIRNRSM